MKQRGSARRHGPRDVRAQAAHAEIRRESFGSGRDNPCGLNVVPRRNGRVFCAVYRPRPAHIGFPRVLHGGITASLLDEVMAYPASRAAGRFVATRDLHVRYLRPVPADRAVRVEAWLRAAWGRSYTVEGRLFVRGGPVLATARARYRVVPADRVGEFFAGSGSPRRVGHGAGAAARRSRASRSAGRAQRRARTVSGTST